MATVLPASAVPVKVGVLSLVMSSLLEAPVSLPASRSGVEGALGTPVSTVTDRAAEAAETLPAAPGGAGGVGVKLGAASAAGGGVMEELPPGAVAVPTLTPLRRMATVLPASAV